MFGSSAPESGVKVSVRFSVTASGYATLNVTVAVDCVAGFAVLGRPVRVTVGVGGRVTVRLNVLVALSPLLSITLTEIENVPGALGRPLKVPAEVMVMPAGNPAAVHV